MAWWSKLLSTTTYTNDPMKYLIAGLGNVGAEYEHTRHNIGFDIVDHLAKSNGAMWKLDSQAYVTEIKHKGRTLVLIKPTILRNADDWQRSTAAALALYGLCSCSRM